MTPEFINACSLDVGPLSNLVDGMVDINSLGGLFSQPWGYIIIRVQIEGVQGYNKDQVALVVPDSTTFGSRMLVILGTQTINWVVNVIKESEISELSVSLNGSRISHILASHQAELPVGSAVAVDQTTDAPDLNEAVKMLKWEEIDASSSKIIYAQTKTAFVGRNMNMMTQALKGGSGPCLPHGLHVMNTYTEMTMGSKKVTVMVKNLTAAPITITKGVKVTQVIMADVIPQVEGAIRTLEEL